MVLGPFLLTRELIPSMEAAAALRGRARVVNVASGGMYTQGLHLDDLQMARNYRGSVAYARAKRAQVVLTETWARRLRDRNITVNAMHPGWADTPGLEAGLPTFRKLTGRFLRSEEEGADTIVWLAASTEAARWTGKFWLDRRPRSAERQPGTHTTPEQAQQLWDVCERLSREGEAATPQ
jgi:NAD(P)-dependent dehydrogenase (short-subunit alcohol dehydrogenase family)